MKNAVGREIPDYLLTEGREVYQAKTIWTANIFRRPLPHPAV